MSSKLMKCPVCDELQRQLDESMKESEILSGEFYWNLFDPTSVFEREETRRQQHEAAIRRCTELADAFKEHCRIHEIELLEFTGDTIN